MTNDSHDPKDTELSEATPKQDASEQQRGGLGLAALLWLLGVPGLIVLLILLL